MSSNTKNQLKSESPRSKPDQGYKKIRERGGG